MSQSRTKDPADAILIRGAREHNLKGIDLDLPKNALVVITGPSGSGKSSLAFDTLYAEGQRRYVESLSSYARQFLGQMEKPKYDTIRGLSPTIAIEQKAASSNPRSTVGTVTEVHDYLRVLYARIGQQHCPTCGRAARAQTAAHIVQALVGLPGKTKVQILAPLERQRKGEHKERMTDAQGRGYSRMRIDGRVLSLDEGIPALDKKSKHDIDIVVDRVVIPAEGAKDKALSARLFDSVEAALREGDGALVVSTEQGDTLYSTKRACLHCKVSFDDLSPQRFSFNSPVGFCPSCNGLGSRPEMDRDLVVPNPKLSIRQGAIAPWANAMSRGEGWTAAEIEWMADLFGVDLDMPFARIPKAKQNAILFGGTRGKQVWEGLLNQLMRRMKATQSEEMKQWYLRYFSDKACTDCGGARLCPASRAVRVGGQGIDAVCDRTIDDAFHFIETLDLDPTDAQIASELRKEILARLGFLRNVGLGYLTLSRAAATLSGGESQRIRLASQIGSELTGVIYVLDEPSIGLHQRDNGKLLATLQMLRDIGNTVIVVEHDEETMRAADHLVDIGPGAGELGGQVVASGRPSDVANAKNSITGAFLAGRRRIEVPTRRRAGSGKTLVVKGAREHNLKNVDVEFPLGTFVAVTGPSGAGKSTLVNRILVPALMRKLHDSKRPIGAHGTITGIEHADKLVEIDQQPIGRTPRSNPATYTKIFDAIRDVFAKTPEARAYGFEPGRFSFNVKGGRCDACDGDGVKKVEMHFLPDVYVTCDVCKGKRFNEATLRVTFKGKTIADVLDMSVREALAHFEHHKDIVRGLRTLDDVGLSYVKLGQPSPTLSGGEAQRIKLARELSKVATGHTLYVLDEPTTGLHFVDVEKLLAVIDRLVEAGNTVVVIEHNLDVIKCADHVIDLGPEGGNAGGRVVACGTPEAVANAADSATGEYLKGHLGAGATAKPSRSRSKERRPEAHTGT
jgi:excinuclease ABC subunit A